MEKILIDAGPSPKSLHRVTDALFCLQWYAYRHVAKLPFATARPLIRGALFHQGMAQLGARTWARQNGQDPEGYYEPLVGVDLLAERERPRWGVHVDTERGAAKDAITAYQGAFQTERDRILHVEHVFEFVVKGPRTGRTWTYTQKPDVVMQDSYTGEIYIPDWKTFSGHYKEDTLTGYGMDMQFLAFQWWGPRVFGKQFGGARVHLVGLTEPRVYKKVPVPASPNLVSRFPEIIEDAELTLERLAVEGRDPFHYPPAANERTCVGRYGPCPAVQTCAWGRSVGPVDPALINFRTEGL